MNSCPCGSGSDYAACCEPIINGKIIADSAEQMMRARYSAHVKVEIDFLFNSTHPKHREGYDHKGTHKWAEESDWYGLEILSSSEGGPEDQQGEVEFIARFRDKEGRRSHHERGQFKREKGQWLFTEGQMVKSQPITANKVGRNDPCRCGSGKKFKKCCG